MTSLSEAQLLRYLVDGYIVIEPETLTDADHDLHYRRAMELYARADGGESEQPHLDILGDHVLDEIPELQRLLDDPAVSGALDTIVGGDRLLHPHHYLHRASSSDQPFHQDGNLPWNVRGHHRCHRPDWALIFYYPQAVDLTNGPTDVVPGSQYWTVDHEKPAGDFHHADMIDRSFSSEDMNHPDLAHRERRLDESLEALGVPGLQRRFLQVPKGAVVVANYDIVHRGSRTSPGAPDRFMFKFYFARMSAPTESFGRDPAQVLDALPATPMSELVAPVVHHIWRWLGGRAEGLARGKDTRNPASTFTDAITEGAEHERVAAAYRLAGQGAFDALGRSLGGATEGTRRAAMHGLRAAIAEGSREAVEVAVSSVSADTVGERRQAVGALGNPQASISRAAIDALLGALDDEDDLVRSNAAYSLGQLFRASPEDPDRLIEGLLARLRSGVEPDNATNGGWARSTVRESAAFALLQAANNGHIGAHRVEALEDIARNDPDRYVRPMAREALARR